MKLLGKKAIVTGANRSIGRAIALAFAREGADVVISYRSDQKEANITIEMIKQLGRSGKCFFADFSCIENVSTFFDQALEYLGQVDILVNNAAAYDTTAFLDLEPIRFEELIKVGITAPMFLSQLSAKQMIAKKISGKIINISSISGNRPYPNRVAHSAAKAALNMLTQSMALELAQYGIRVNGIAPGMTSYEDTPVVENLSIPLRRVGIPLDHAQAAVFLVSEESSWMTGQMIIVDGGQSLSYV